MHGLISSRLLRQILLPSTDIYTLASESRQAVCKAANRPA